MTIKYKQFIASRSSKPEAGSTGGDLNIDNDLERAVNDWLSENDGIEVVQMTQSQLVNSGEERKWTYAVILSLLYKPNEQEESKDNRHNI